MSNDCRLRRFDGVRALQATCLGAWLGLAGCSGPATPEDAAAAPAEAGESAPAKEALLLPGTRETLVDGIAAVENVLFSQAGRLFVTGDDAIYEITKPASGVASAKALTANAGCKFAGMAELGGVLYANCYDGTNSKIFAGKLDPSPVFRSIYDLPGVALANGATTDGTRLYVADSTHGTIWALSLDAANPFGVASKDAFSTGNLFPNGLKFFDSSIYFTDFVAIKRTPVLAGGHAGTTTTLNAQLTFFDDLNVDASGIFVANYLFGYLEWLTPNGVDLFDTAAALSGPSAVLPAKGRLGLAATDLIVTEKSANRVAVFHQR